MSRVVKAGVAEMTQGTDSSPLARGATYFKCMCSDSETAPPLQSGLDTVSLSDTYVIQNADQYCLVRANANWDRGVKVV